MKKHKTLSLLQKSLFVIPEVFIGNPVFFKTKDFWIPAFAGTTAKAISSIHLQEAPLTNSSQFTPASSRSVGTGQAVHRSRGFTITELMVAIVISAIAMAAVYSTFIVQQRSFVIQDQVSETQVSSKIAFNMLTDRIMGAGFGYPLDENPIITTPTGPVSDIIGTLDAGASVNPDSIIIVGGSLSVGTLGIPAGQSTTTVDQYDYSAGGYYMDVCYSGSTMLNTTNERYATVDGVHYAEVLSFNNTAGVADCNLDGITNDTSARLIIDRPLPARFPVSIPVYLVSGDTISIAASCTAGTDCLQIATPAITSTLATDIEDIQFAYAVDIDNDGQIDDQNGNSTFDPGDYKSPPLLAGEEILAVRVSLFARSANEDPNLAPASKPYYPSITLENGSAISTADSFRRRLITKEILIRNPR